MSLLTLKIMESSIGERLKTARLARRLSLEQAAQQTRIRKGTLEAMENDDFDVIPSRAQLYGFVRLYAEYLALDGETLVSELRGTPARPPANPPSLPESEPGDMPLPEAQAANQDELPEDALQEDEPLAPSVPVSLSQSIFVEIGAQFRTRRELLSLTLGEIERHTHVRKHYLECIEKGAFAELPSPVQARGMLTAYARFLDIDPEALLLRFAEGLQARRIENLPPISARAARTRAKIPFLATLGRYITIDLLFGIGLVLSMTFFAIWGANRIIQLSQGAGENTADGPSISEVLLTPIQVSEVPEEASPTAALVLDPEDVTLAANAPEIIATPLPTLPSRANVQVIISVAERAFLRVIVDNKEVFNGRAEAGSAFPFEGNQRIEVLTGNGASVQIVYNQQNLGPMGTFGEVVNMVYTPNGIQTPTPTIVPTATITPSPTRTPRPSPTLPPTRTPRPSPAPTLEPGG